MNKAFQIGFLSVLCVIALLLFQHSQNGRYQYSTVGTIGVIVDTRTGEYWTEDGTHFEPRSAHITTHHPSIDDQTASDDSTNKFRECLQDAVAHHNSAKNCVEQKYGTGQDRGISNGTSPSSSNKTAN